MLVQPERSLPLKRTVQSSPPGLAVAGLAVAVCGAPTGYVGETTRVWGVDAGACARTATRKSVEVISGERFLYVGEAFRDLHERIALVLELDVHRDVPLVLLNQLENRFERRVPLPERGVATAVRRLLH